MKILITGSSGFIGSSLIPFLQRHHHEIYQLVRKKPLLSHQIFWDPEKGSIDAHALEGLDVFIHLAGETIWGLWTATKKEKIKESRIKSTHLLVQTLSQLKKPPTLFLSASAIGYYGSRGEEILVEESEKGVGFLSDICKEWEEAALKAPMRSIQLRFGMVLSPRGGALKQMLPLFQWGLGGKIGTGRQWVSWIAIPDLVRIIQWAIDRKDLHGPLNVVSPHPVTNEELTKALASALQRKAFLSVPEFVVQAVFGQFGEELLLSSQKVIPKKLQETGFQFDYPYLEDALRHLLKSV